MAKAYIGNNSYKLMVGNTKISRAYLGNVLVYSGDITVTYHITNDIVYEETVEEGQNCLQPKSFNPALLRRGYENKFLGWRLDTESSPDVLETLDAGSNDIDLYAVYYREYTVNFYNGSTTPTTVLYRSYINNESPILYPKTGVEESTLNNVTGYTNKLGWTDVIWNNQTRNYSQKYSSGAQIEIKQDTNLYSVYNTNVTMTIINGSGSGVEKSYVAGVRSRQYTPTINTFNPLLNLQHNNVSGWNNGGWSFNGSAEKSLDDGNDILITRSFDDDIKTINALYTKNITVYSINGDNKKVTHNLVVTRVCKNEGITIAPAKLSLTHTTVSGWENHGWNITADSTTTVYNDGIIDIDDTFADKTFYALYKKPISFTVVNGGNKKTSYKKYIYIQYNTASTRYTEADKITLQHSTVTNYTSYGWNTTKNDVVKKYNDGEISVRSEFNGQELYALYSKAFTLYTVNGNLKKTSVTMTRYLQYNGSLYTSNPNLSLTHTSIADLTNNGWNFGDNNDTAIISGDGVVAIPESYDGKTLYALYKRTVKVTFYTAPATYVSKSGTQYHRATVGSWSITYPTVKHTVPSLSDWTALGWITTKTAGVPTYSSNADIKVTDNMTVYAIYRQSITLTVESKGTVTEKYDGIKYRYYNRPLSLYNNPKFTVPDPSAVSNRSFLGWANVQGSTTVAYAHFTNIALDKNTYIGALWKQDDYTVYDYGSTYKTYSSSDYSYTGGPYDSKLLVVNLDSIDTNWYDRVSVTMQAYLENGKWVVASWAYCVLFPGTIPSTVKYATQPKPNTEVRGINMWEAGGWHVETDEGPCAQNNKATITANLVASPNQGSIAKVSIAFVEDYYIGYNTRFNLYKLVRLGKTRIW